jgi:hypothetical protein
MKSITFAFFLVCAGIASFSQKANVPVNEDTGLITWQAVVEQNGEPITLYNRCIEWINSQYKNSQEVTKVRKPEEGLIVINHGIRLYDTLDDGNIVASNTVVNYVLRLEFKENRYRYTFTDFTMKAMSRYPLERWLDEKDATYSLKWNGYLVQVDAEVSRLIKSLKEGMIEKVVKPDEW